jgi:molybdopterin-guanine dinucleotide biosynthesis protein A
MTFEVCILAGGLSRRMGRDKARMRLGGRTLLGHARAVAAQAGLPARVIRKDVVPRCGPLGGVVTVLRSSRAAAAVFLSCDLPLISASALRVLIQHYRRGNRPVFYADAEQGVGFPFALGVAQLPLVERQLARAQFSLQHLAGVVRALRLAIPSRERWRWLNVNTPEELAQARELLRAAKPGRVSRKPRLVPATKAVKLRP